MTLQTNKIIHGNALDVLKDFPDNSVDLVLTDPPFKVSQMYGGGTDADNLKRNWIGIEIEQKYVALSQKNLERCTFQTLDSLIVSSENRGKEK